MGETMGGLRKGKVCGGLGRSGGWDAPQMPSTAQKWERGIRIIAGKAHG